MTAERMSAEALELALRLMPEHVAIDMAVHLRALQREADNGARFKAYVHQRLDDAGIPTHPDGEHSAAGCRVGDRLDIALSYKSEAEAERARADAMREALQTIAIGYVVAGGVIRDAAGGVMDYVEPEEKPLRAEVAQSIARAALSQARGEPSLSSEGK